MEREVMREIIKRNREALGMVVSERCIDIVEDFNKEIHARTMLIGSERRSDRFIIADGLIVGLGPDVEFANL